MLVQKKIFSLLLGLFWLGTPLGWSAPVSAPSSKDSEIAEKAEPSVSRKVKMSGKKNIGKKSTRSSKSVVSKKSSDSTRRFKINPSRPPVGTPEFQEEEDGIMKATLAFVDFDLPTDNQMIFSRGETRKFFQPTFSGRTISAMFGYVRNPGYRGTFTRFHEGIDIRPVERDESGEPQDEVRSAGQGRLVHICRQPRGSNYGQYVVVEHDLFGPPLYTLYAHLSSVEEDLQIGDLVEKGQKLGILGRTSSEYNIELEYAHLHFEVNLMANDRYVEWCRKRGMGEPNHGIYNGANLIGLDPVNFLKFLQINPDLGVAEFVLREKVAFRVLVPFRKNFSWIRRYPFALTRPIPENVYAFEIAMTYYGLPVSVTPRSRKEISAPALVALSRGIYPLTYANAAELVSHSHTRLVRKRGKQWGLASKGADWLNQLLY